MSGAAGELEWWIYCLDGLGEHKYDDQGRGQGLGKRSLAGKLALLRRTCPAVSQCAMAAEQMSWPRWMTMAQRNGYYSWVEWGGFRYNRIDILFFSPCMHIFSIQPWRSVTLILSK